MDDDENPLAARDATQQEDDEDEDGGEEVPDWTQLARLSRSTDADKPWTEAFIPKRGDKDFEPDPSRAAQQQDTITASREALFSALSAGQRGHSSRDHVQVIWHPSLQRAHVEGSPKGVHFGSMGAQNQTRKRLELYPEEALYLFERGAVEVWSEGDEKRGSVPMSVDWAWSEMIRSDGLTLERYQVYAYLRRLGYSVLRKSHVDTIHASSRRTRRPAPPPVPSFLESFTAAHLLPARYLIWALLHPVRFAHRLLPHLPRLGDSQRRRLGPADGGRALVGKRSWPSYDAIFRALRVVPSRHDREPTSAPSTEGYDIFWYLYKPSHHFPKTAPPPPDFQVAVVESVISPDAEDVVLTRATRSSKSALLPDLPQLTAVLDDAYSARYSDPIDVSVPRRRPQSTPPPPPPPPISARLYSYLSSLVRPRRPTGPGAIGPIYGRLKAGRRNVVLAVADDGIVSFLRFAETDFAAVPLTGEK